eukprot:c4499_g1_i2.p1 GENE.c4499_g1_i2~~c4499_g1_i2.p1  ORF type:complete len:762 (+),score=150.49 c4499_g1_i2:107-2392(+)
MVKRTALSRRSVGCVVVFVFLCLESAIGDMASLQCVNIQGWRDMLNCGCSDYEQQRVCAQGGFLSPTYKTLSTSTSLSDYKASTACCACGGGEADECSNAFATWSANQNAVPFFGLMDLSGCAISNRKPSCMVNQCRQVLQNSNVRQYRAVGEISFSCFANNGEHSISADAGQFICTPCTDVSGWADKDGFTCDDYRNYRLCGGSGRYGEGWLSDSALEPYSFRSFANKGVDATQACCACGGGVLNTQSSCDVVDDIPFASNFVADACLITASSNGRSCPFTCKAGYQPSGSHTCNQYGHVTGGRCIASRALDSTAPNSVPTISKNNPESWRWEVDDLPLVRMLAPFAVAGDGSKDTVVSNITHVVFYVLSWLMTTIFAIKVVLRGTSFEIFGFLAVATTATYTLFEVISSHALYCHSFQRLAFLLFQIGLITAVTGLTRVAKEKTIVKLHNDYHDQVEKHREEAKQHLMDEQNSLSAHDDSNESDQNVLQSFAANEEQGNKALKSQNSTNQASGNPKTDLDLEELVDANQFANLKYGIQEFDVTGEIKSGAGWNLTTAGVVVMLLSIVYYFTVCHVQRKKFDLAMGRRVGQTTTEGSQTSNLAIRGHHVIASTEVDPNSAECAETLIENDPSWFIDLGEEFTIDSAVVQGGCEYQDSDFDYSNFPVRVEMFSEKAADGSFSMFSCGGEFLLIQKQENVVSCKQSRARYVRISYSGFSGVPKRMCICSVHVIGDDSTAILNVPTKSRPNIPASWPLTQCAL